MNFYELLNISKKRNTKRFSDLSELEVNRIEKELRLENRMNNSSGSEEMLNFLKVLYDAPIGLDFLIDNPNLSQAIFLKEPRFNESIRMQVRNYQKKEIQHFFSEFLHIELENAISEATAKSHYSRLFQITKFNRYFPEDIVLLLKSKILDRLKFIETRVNSGVFNVFKELEKIKTMVIFLGDQNLIQKEKTIHNKLLKNSLKGINEPGIVSFFKMIGDFFEALATQPKNIIEREKKRGTLKGCAWVFMVVFIIFIFSLVFVMLIAQSKNKAEEYPPYHKLSNKFQDYLTDFNRTEIADYRYVGPIYKGNVLNSQFREYPKKYSLMVGPTIINESSYDLIIYSTDNLSPIDNSAKAAATYISSGKNKSVGAYYLHRLYFGDSLARFKTRYDKIESKTNRFMIQPSFSKKAIGYQLLFRNRLPITVKDTLDRVILNGEGFIELRKPDGVSTIKELPFIFPID